MLEGTRSNTAPATTALPPNEGELPFGGVVVNISVVAFRVGNGLRVSLRAGRTKLQTPS
jgi:hypothetical protein